MPKIGDQHDFAVVENKSLLGTEPEESLANWSGANAKVRCKNARDEALTGLKPPAHKVAFDLLIGLLAEATSGKRLKQAARCHMRIWVDDHKPDRR